MPKALTLSLATAGVLAMVVSTIQGDHEAFKLFWVLGVLSVVLVDETDAFAFSRSVGIIAAILLLSSLTVLVLNEFGLASTELVLFARWTLISTLAISIVGRVRTHVALARARKSSSSANPP